MVEEGVIATRKEDGGFEALTVRQIAVDGMGGMDIIDMA